MTDTATIDATFVPDPWPWITAVELDGEEVLFNGSNGRVHLLDRPGSLAWQLFDGQTSVATASMLIAEAVGADVDVVRADVIALVRMLADLGLLVGFEPAAVEPPAP
jgi:hypothetical protein